MDERFDELLRSLEGERPSPDFVARLRSDVLAEASAHSDRPALASDTDARSTSRLRSASHPATPPRRSWPMLLIGAAAAMTLVVVLAFRGSDGSQVVTTDRPPDVDRFVTTTPDETPDALPDDPVDEESEQFDPTAEIVDRDPAFIEAGQHRIDSLGTPFTFRLQQAVFVEPNTNGAVALSDATASGEPGDRDIHLMRLSALSDPARPTEPLDELSDGWPAEDPDGWLDRLPDGIIVSDRETTRLGGLPALRIELQIEQDACDQESASCVVFGTNNVIASKTLSAGASYRVWFVEQIGEDPLAVLVGIRDQSDEDWFDVAEGVLSSLAFGEVAPNPVTAVSPGRVELPFLGGVSLEFTQADVTTDAHQRGVVALLGDDGDSEFLTTLVSSDGEPLESTDDLVATLTPLVTSLTESEPTVVGGLPARVFEVSGAGTTRPSLLRSPDDQRGWFAPPGGRLWLVEHPDRGLLMITAESGRTDGPEFDAVLQRAERLVASLEFIG